MSDLIPKIMVVASRNVSSIQASALHGYDTLISAEESCPAFGPVWPRGRGTR